MGRRPKEQAVKHRINRSKMKKPALAPTGLSDILPANYFYLKKIFSAVEEMAEYYGFGRFESPLVEKLETISYSRGLKKEEEEKILALKSRRGEFLALRPDLAVGGLRAFLENKLVGQKPVKLFSFGQVFREGAAKDKESVFRRRLWRASFQIIGGDDSIYDALVVRAASSLLADLKIKAELEVNSIGCDNCRSVWQSNWKGYFSSSKQNFCSACRKLGAEGLCGGLSCQNEKCVEIFEESPRIMDCFCLSCRRHFMSFLEYLEAAGVVFNVNPRLFGDRRYFDRTVFRFNDENGKCLISGGRYDHLAEVLGYKAVSGIEAEANVDFLAEILSIRDNGRRREKRGHVFLAPLGDLAKKKGLEALEIMRKSGIVVAESFGRDSLKAQLKHAEKLGIDLAVIIGQKEAVDGTAIVRDLKFGSQETVAREKIPEEIRKKIKNLK